MTGSRTTTDERARYSLFPIPYSLFPYSLFPIPYSPIPYSPIPYSLFLFPINSTFTSGVATATVP